MLPANVLQPGLHGANRLASNSLLESLVYSHRACIDASEKLKHIDLCHEIPDWNAEGTVMNEEMVLITQTMRELQGIMTNYVGIVRSNLRLKRAADRLKSSLNVKPKIFTNTPF